MALNIKDPESERLAAELAAATATTKTGAVRDALRARRQQLADRAGDREGELLAFFEEEIWPQVRARGPQGVLSKQERERILGYGPDGV